MKAQSKRAAKEQAAKERAEKLQAEKDSNAGLNDHTKGPSKSSSRAPSRKKSDNLSTGKKPGGDAPDKIKPDEAQTKSAPLPSETAKYRTRNCRFYMRGHCLHGDKCTYIHPDVCKTYKSKGICKDKKCKMHHPQPCVNSWRNRVCRKPGCNDYHLNGTNEKNSGGPKGGNNGLSHHRGDHDDNRNVRRSGFGPNFGGGQSSTRQSEKFHPTFRVQNKRDYFLGNLKASMDAMYQQIESLIVQF